MEPVEREWNKFLESFLKLGKQWATFQAALRLVEHREDLSVMGQKISGLASARSDFFVAVPRLVEWARRYGGLEALMIEETKPKREKKEKEDANE